MAVIIHGFGICYMSNACVHCPVISVQVEICYMLNVCVLSRYLSPVVEMRSVIC